MAEPLMKKTKVELIEIINRKDRVETELREKLANSDASKIEKEWEVKYNDLKQKNISNNVRLNQLESQLKTAQRLESEANSQVDELRECIDDLTTENAKRVNILTKFAIFGWIITIIMILLYFAK